MDNENLNRPVTPIQQMPAKTIPTPPTKITDNKQDEKKNSAATFISVFILAGLIIAGGFYVLPYIKTPELPPAPIIHKTVQTSPPVVPEPVKSAMVKTPNVEVIKPAATKSPDAVVEEFYNWYTNYKGDPISDGAYKTNSALNEELVKKIQISYLKNDPFLCVSKPVAGFEVGQAAIESTSSTVSVNVKKSGKIYPVKIRLQLDGEWKMTNITCLSENGGNSVLENFKQEYNLDYLTSENSSFYWNLPDWKGREVQKVNGESLKTENADLPTDALKNFLLKNGFESDSYNDNGYKKSKTVCVSSDTAKENGKHDFELKCGEILYYY